MNKEKLMLRSIYLEPELDREYKLMAFMAGISKNDLMRIFLSFGIDILREEGGDGKLDIEDLKINLAKLFSKYEDSRRINGQKQD